ncbi:hypothetical protein VNI00_014607 [Paramarasmius palmivorus]|uniref:non-specific serine/threonine protein kinase n=1 Tax=Paramarasmius palmivorus TaxID=297713 RepID=A0AAW0BT26_9AGAR
MGGRIWISDRESVRTNDTPSSVNLGWGGHSSTWLSCDNTGHSFVAIKVCTTHITQLDRKNLVWESDALRAVSNNSTSPHSIQVLSEFTFSDESGDHLCFVTPLYAGDVSALIAVRATQRRLSLPLAKRILLHLLRGLCHSHSRCVVHADIKLDNILIDAHVGSAEVERFLADNPPRRHDPELSYEGATIQSAVSQSLPMISLEKALEATYVLGDYGCAQPSNLHDARVINIAPNRPPEVWLDGKWDKPADIWAFGCVAFEIVTGRTLFMCSRAKTWNMSEPHFMLYQMSSKTGEFFTAELLRQWPGAINYFNPHNCSFKSFVEGKEVEIYSLPLETSIRDAVDLEPSEIDAMAALMYRCLHLDPEARASAEELLQDPWFLE